MNIILASKSPRRKQLLEEAGFDIVVKTMDTDESYPGSLATSVVAEYIANKKLDAAKIYLESKDDLLIASDTIVVLGDDILGKPKDKNDAIQILKRLSNTKHTVITGVSMCSLEKSISFSSMSHVWLGNLSDAEIEFYLEKYQPYDKAGSYGIQEWIGLCKIKKIEGTYANIMGLPVDRIYEEVKNW